MSKNNTNINRGILRIMLEIKNRAIDAEVVLIANGLDDDARKLSQSIDRLDDIIMKLRKLILDNWLDRVDNFRSKLGKMNAEIQETIDDIKDDIETAEKIIKLIGYIDDVINIASKVII